MKNTPKASLILLYVPMALAALYRWSAPDPWSRVDSFSVAVLLGDGIEHVGHDEREKQGHKHRAQQPCEQEQRAVEANILGPVNVPGGDRQEQAEDGRGRVFRRRGGPARQAGVETRRALRARLSPGPVAEARVRSCYIVRRSRRAQ